MTQGGCGPFRHCAEYELRTTFKGLAQIVHWGGAC